MKKLALFVVLALAFTSLEGCSDEPGTRKALAQAGYTDVVTTGFSLFGCDEKDAFSTGFKAKGPAGIETEGVVCSGWFKGSTIRTK